MPSKRPSRMPLITPTKRVYMKGPESKYECLLHTLDLLDRLVSVHNDIFNRSIFKILSPIPFMNLKKTLDQTIEEIQQTQANYPKLPAGPIPLDWQSLDAQYPAYCNGIISAYSKLSSICGSLDQKASGNSYDSQTYSQDIQEYQRLVNSYQIIGNRLNQIMNS